MLRWWAVTLLLVVWVALFVVACASWTPRPTRLPWLAGIGFVIWAVVLVVASLAAG